MTDRIDHRCSELSKNSTPCTKTATFSAALGTDTFWYCGLHKQKHALKQQTYIQNHLKENPLRSSARAKLAKDTALKPIIHKTCKQLAIVDLKLSLWRQLDAVPHVLQVDHVVIENQPAVKNPVMKSIAETLFAYFLCRGIIDRNQTNATIEKVQYVSASNKVKLADEFQKELAAATNKYKTTKNLAIRTCTLLLSDDPVGSAFLKTHKKKDDLCDCLLQGLYFLKKLQYEKAITHVQYLDIA